MGVPILSFGVGCASPKMLDALQTMLIMRTVALAIAGPGAHYLILGWGWGVWGDTHPTVLGVGGKIGDR